MSLASRLADLTTAIAVALNTRKVGASAFDLAVINGYTGTQAQWLSAIPGVKRYTSLALLIADVANVPEGMLGVVSTFTLGGAYTHQRSLWVKSNGLWSPAPGSKIVVSTTNPYYVGNIQSAASLISDLATANATSLNLPIGTIVISADRGAGSNTPIEVIYESGTSWGVWNATNVYSGYAAFLNGAGGDTNAGAFDMSVSNGMATFTYNLYRGSGNFSTGVSYLQMAVGWRPITSGGANNAGINFVGTMFNGPTVVAMYLGGDGNLFWVNGGTAGQAMRGVVTYRIAGS